MARKLSEKRQHLRFPVVLPVDFGRADYYLSSMSINLSQNGLFIETSEPLKIGDRVCLFISLPNQSDPFKVIGEVMWASARTTTDINDNVVSGIGIRFLGEYHEGENLLKGFLNTRDNNETFFVENEEQPMIL